MFNFYKRPRFLYNRGLIRVVSLKFFNQPASFCTFFQLQSLALKNPAVINLNLSFFKPQFCFSSPQFCSPSPLTDCSSVLPHSFTAETTVVVQTTFIKEATPQQPLRCHLSSVATAVAIFIRYSVTICVHSFFFLFFYQLCFVDYSSP